MCKDMWYPIPGYPLYEITEYGDVRNIKTGRFLKGHIDEDGYPKITVRDEFGKPRHLQRAKLVAITFIPNPNNKPTVDHIDTDRMNCHYTNLRWASRKEQSNNPLTKEHYARAKRSRVVKQSTKEKLRETSKGNQNGNKRVICTTTGEIYDSIKCAAEKNGLRGSNISRAIHTEGASCGRTPSGDKMYWRLWQDE